MHVLSAGDLDARYLGSRATLEPLFASYGMPANSDYAPVLDLNAARHRFMEKSATDLVALLNADVPLLEMLEPGRSRRPVNPLLPGRVRLRAHREHPPRPVRARLPLRRQRRPAPEAVPTQLQKDLELVQLRLIECREPRELDVWLHSAVRVARAHQPVPRARRRGRGVGAHRTRALLSPSCTSSSAAGWRCSAPWRRAMPRAWRELAARCSRTQTELGAEAREYLLMAAHGRPPGARRTAAGARALARAQAELRARGRSPAFRLLRCHAERARAAQPSSGAYAAERREAHRAEHRATKVPALARPAKWPSSSRCDKAVHQRPGRGGRGRRVVAAVGKRSAAALRRRAGPRLFAAQQAAEHQPEALRVRRARTRHRPRPISRPGLGAAAHRRASRNLRPPSAASSAVAIGKVPVGGVVRNPGPARHLPQA